MFNYLVTWCHPPIFLIKMNAKYKNERANKIIIQNRQSWESLNITKARLLASVVFIECKQATRL